MLNYGVRSGTSEFAEFTTYCQDQLISKKLYGDLERFYTTLAELEFWEQLSENWK